MPENLQPPRAAQRILSYFASPHLPQILGDLMEEFNERVQSNGLSGARRWYWRATLHNLIALRARGEITGKTLRSRLFLISAIWFALALLLMWLSHGWLMGFERQAWGVMTAVVFLLYSLLMIGWLVPLLWALIRLVSPSHLQGKHVR